METEILKAFRAEYLKNINSKDKNSYYFNLGEISYSNLKQGGIKNFRDFSNGCGLGYSDSVIIDPIATSSKLKKIVVNIINFLTFGKINREQKILNKRLIDDWLRYIQLVYSKNKNVLRLVKKYKINNSTHFGCKKKFKIDGKFYSTHYLEICNKIDFINSYCKLGKLKTYCEVGGGFGANIHLIEQNFKNIKKFLLIDTFPTIYVAAHYLKKFYGKAVLSYHDTKKFKEISFKNDNRLEIICIPFWDIDKVKVKIDHFHNGDSFSHLDTLQIKKYIKFLKKNHTKSFSINDLEFEKYKKTSPQVYAKYLGKKFITRRNQFVIEGLRKSKNIFFIGMFDK